MRETRGELAGNLRKPVGDLRELARSLRTCGFLLTPKTKKQRTCHRRLSLSRRRPRDVLVYRFGPNSAKLSRHATTAQKLSLTPRIDGKPGHSLAQTDRLTQSDSLNSFLIVVPLGPEKRSAERARSGRSIRQWRILWRWRVLSASPLGLNARHHHWA